MEETEQGEENTLYCYISHFYPPSANITWTKNGVQVTEGVALSNLHPETDGTFSQLASLSFHPETDDVLGCSVQHQALSRPVTKTWGEKIQGFLEIYCNVEVQRLYMCVVAGVILQNDWKTHFSFY